LIPILLRRHLVRLPRGHAAIVLLGQARGATAADALIGFPAKPGHILDILDPHCPAVDPPLGALLAPILAFDLPVDALNLAFLTPATALLRSTLHRGPVPAVAAIFPVGAAALHRALGLPLLAVATAGALAAASAAPVRLLTTTAAAVAALGLMTAAAMATALVSTLGFPATAAAIAVALG
jgi:hypothetical protein